MRQNKKPELSSDSIGTEKTLANALRRIDGLSRLRRRTCPALQTQ
jgi:hypothetical protein